MSKQRKQIIVNEITFWKQNKLLPEHYCDFLMTLYTEGEQDQSTIGDAKKSVKAQEKRKGHAWLYLAPFIAIGIVVLVFLVDWVLLVAIPGGIFAIVLAVLGIRFLKEHGLLGPVLQLSAALILLGISIRVCLTYFNGNNTALYITLIFNCVLWLITGLGLRLLYFTIAGAVGIVAIIIYGGFL